MGMRLSEHASFDFMETVNIKNTNAQNAGSYLSMKDYDRVMAYVELGTFDAADNLTTCKLEQAKTSGGSVEKDLTTSASGGNYDTDNPVDADGDFVILEARAEDLDVDGSYEYVRLYVASSDNTGVDNVTGVLIRYGFSYPKKELQGVASTGAKVYVDPGT